MTDLYHCGKERGKAGENTLRNLSYI
uniref:Uncharacterized protein n=1 Tax=Anguilla anguilla TaxID=7936 RepID=A0A0E9W3X1_ANGAN